MQRQHSEDLGQQPSVTDLKDKIQELGIPDSAILSGWDDGGVVITWWAEETADERRNRVLNEAQVAYYRERAGR